jgi:hypothetical protein
MDSKYLSDSDLISNASQTYGSYQAYRESGTSIQYNLYYDEIVRRRENGVDFSKHLEHHAKNLQEHIYRKYNTNDQSFAYLRDAHAVRWLKSQKNNTEKINQVKHFNNVEIKSSQLKKILSQGIPTTDEEWLNAVCLTNDIDVRDLLRMKFGPQYFTPDYVENFQFPCKGGDLIFVKEIVDIFPELRKYCKNYECEFVDEEI